MGRKKKRLKRSTSNKIRTRISRLAGNILKRRNEHINKCMRQSIEETAVEPSSKKENTSLREELGLWVGKNRIAKRAVNSLLSILSSNGINSLPKDYRTLLRTQTNTEIMQVAGGQFWYNGLAKNLKLIFASLDRNISISLNFNIDGLPLFKSSKRTFWPILGSIHGTQIFTLFKIKICYVYLNHYMSTEF